MASPAEEEKIQTYNCEIHEFHIICRVIILNPPSTPIHHLNTEQFPFSYISNRRDIRMPAVVERDLLLPWLLLHIYGHYQSRSQRSHVSLQYLLKSFFPLEALCSFIYNGRIGMCMLMNLLIMVKIGVWSSESLSRLGRNLFVGLAHLYRLSRAKTVMYYFLVLEARAVPTNLAFSRLVFPTGHNMQRAALMYTGAQNCFLAVCQRNPNFHPRNSRGCHTHTQSFPSC